MDVKYIEGVLSSQQIIKKSSFYDILVDWLGRGLVTSSGKKWHTRRRIITPTFHFKILEQFIEIFDQQSTVLVKKMYNKADGKTPINIYPEVSLAALDIITGKRTIRVALTFRYYLIYRDVVKTLLFKINVFFIAIYFCHKPDASDTTFLHIIIVDDTYKQTLHTHCIIIVFLFVFFFFSNHLIILPCGRIIDALDAFLVSLRL